uniref:Major sperm protein n=1 Tax=Steinernema glaseri TaxID=37863 RepID=A0A1I7Y580_9BILA
MSPKKKDDEKKEEEDKKKEELQEDEKKEEKEDERKEENKEEEKNDSNKDKVKSPAKSRDVAVAPNALSFPEKGSLKQLIIMNTTDQRLAVKVKCSDNQLYRVAPVFGFCPQKGTLKVDVLRREGP